MQAAQFGLGELSKTAQAVIWEDGVGRGLGFGEGAGDTGLSSEPVMARGETTWRCPRALGLWVSQGEGESQRAVNRCRM